MANHLYKKVVSKESEELSLFIEFEEKCFTIIILQLCKAWNSYISRNHLQKAANVHGLVITEYYKKLKTYFTQLSEDVELSFSSNKFSLYILLKNEMKYVYFCCDLGQVSFNDCVMNIIEKTYNEKCVALEQLNEVVQTTANYEQRANELQNKLEEFVQRKTIDEEEIYSNFLAILNEKKIQIQHLNETLIAFKHGRPTINPQIEVKRLTSKKNIKKAELKKEIKQENSDEDDIQNDKNELEDNYNTDDEKEKMLLESSDDEVDRNISSPVPSTSKHKFDILFDESPPHYQLPKRLKVNTNNGSMVKLNEPSTSREQKFNNDVEEKKEVECNRKTAVVNFNTQELLDNI